MSNNYQEKIKSLEAIKYDWEKRRLFYKAELAKIDDTSKIFTLQQAVTKCNEEIQETIQEIESLRQEVIQINKSILQRIYQELENIPIQDKPIEIFATSQITE
ncbi:MAG: hypothetical protein F6K31_38895, partial [Symploca sp. SIO2G7]|nr:hypothetical protein [Symploca sp. SIO2G7]